MRTKQRYSSVEEAVEAIADGRIVIVVDAEDRENEGDFVAAAEKIAPQVIHFMITHGRGQLCMPLLPPTARRLDLTPMVPQKTLALPRFTIPVDHRRCRTGISPEERALTIRAIVDPNTGPEDFVRPGHVFPLIAQTRGVLRRVGHTEAAVDLARLAGLTPAGVLCEICSRDGLHMASGPELQELASQFGMPIITIGHLVAFRRRSLPTAEKALVTLRRAVAV
ncbi:MAG: 3,4-dihydroxy-2-butanone-4-phosphate synthase [Planctomycetes bacterium]|nr:3,4-dihydroxy-2-butanone-4-phosphate synthase [Planctomycetota bacterium]